MGTETEYSVYAPGKRQAMICGNLSRNFAQLTPENLYVPTDRGYKYMTSGAMFYVDVGSHPEYCTPEVFGPMAAVIVEEAGVRLMRQVAQDLRGMDDLTDKDLEDLGIAKRDWQENRKMIGDKEYLLRNVAGQYDAWGHHINMCANRNLRVDEEHLAPLLLTMLGGISLFGAGRATELGKFHKFQKAPYIHEYVTNDTQIKRPLINTRDEPHADPAKFQRLHIVGNDALHSPWAKWLRFGAYELAISISESSPKVARELAQYLPELPSKPLTPTARRAVMAFSFGHPTKTTVTARNGQEYSMVNYLEIVQEQIRGLVEQGRIPVEEEYRERPLVIDELGEAITMLSDDDSIVLNRLVDSSTRAELHEEIRESKVKQQKELKPTQLNAVDVLLDENERRLSLAERYQSRATDESKARLCKVYGITPERFDELADKYMVDPYPGRAVIRGKFVSDGAEWVAWEKWKQDTGDKWEGELDPYKGAKKFPFWEEAA